MCYSLALISKGRVRTLVRCVEESNGGEAWRLIQNRYPQNTQNRQYALMQKIMMPAKLFCDHSEGFESGVRAWELDVGEWERASGTALADAVKYRVMMNMAPIFLGTVCNSVHTQTMPLFEQLCCNGVTLPETLQQIRPCQPEMELSQMMTGCKSTLSKKKGKGTVKANTKTRKEVARPARPTRALQT